MEAAEVSAAKAMQPEPAATVSSGLDEKVEVVGAEEDEEENLPPVLHKAWDAPRLRALNEVLGQWVWSSSQRSCCWRQWRHLGGRRVTRCQVVRRWWCVARFSLDSTKEDEGWEQWAGWPRQTTTKEEERATCTGRSWGEE